MRNLRFLSALLSLTLLIGIFSPSAQALTDMPELHGEYILLANLNTDKVLFSKNADQPLYPANITKLMTAVLVFESISDLETEVTVSESALEGTKNTNTSALKAGEVMTVRNLLYCLLIKSANDAANALAEEVSGSVSAFVDRMNARAKELGMENTNYVNATGLQDESQVSTVNDLYLLTKRALAIPGLMEILNTQYKRIPATNMTSVDRYYSTPNHLISTLTETQYRYKYADGLLAGGTRDAGYNLITSATQNNTGFVCIIMKAPRDEETKTVYSFVDAKALLEWAFQNYSYTRVLRADEPVTEVVVELANVKNQLVLIPKEEYRALIPSDAQAADLTREFVIQEEIVAPVELGQELGEVILKYNGVEYGRTKLVAQIAVERSSLLYVLDRIGYYMGSIWMKILLLTVLSIVVLYTLLMMYLNKHRRKKRRTRSNNRYR